MKLANFNAVNTIIFDLGGVILNIDYHITASEFEKLGVEDFNNLYSQFKQSNLFDELETGAVTPEEFRANFRTETGLNVTDTQIDYAWNAMLLDLPQKRIELLQELSKHFQLFLLSNTNEIHYKEYVAKIERENGITNFNSLFTKAYYSHEIGLRKPDAAAFQLIVDENKLNPQNALFIDDSPQHLVGAKQVGLQTHHLITPETILDLFI